MEVLMADEEPPRDNSTQTTREGKGTIIFKLLLHTPLIHAYAALQWNNS